MEVPGWTSYTLKGINIRSSASIDPAKFPDEVFELYSVPSFDRLEPENLYGREIRSTKQIVETGDVLICKINPRINRVWIVGNVSSHRKIASSEWIVVSTNGHFDSSFLRYEFSAPFFRRMLESEVSGVGGSLTRARPKVVEHYSFPAPPLREQKLIVAKLDKLFAHLDRIRERLDKVPALLKQFRQAVLTQVALNDEYERVPLQDLVIQGGIFDGPFGSNLKTSDYTKTGVRVIRLENIGHLSFIDESKVFISKQKYQALKRHEVHAGDIIFSSFIADQIRTCMVPKIKVKAIAKADCFCIRANEDIVNKSFLLMVLASKHSYEQLTSHIHGMTRPRINTSQLKQLIVPMPSLDKQREIVQRVESLLSIADRIEARYKALKERIDNLPQAILSKAFRGELVKGVELLKGYEREMGDVMMAAEP